MGAARPSAGVAALNGSFVEFDGSGALGHNRLFAKGSLLASHLTMYVQSVTNL